ncbi:MAG: DUF4392 domain-containing protein [Nitrososphaeria archaeon]|nr:DUF4392 domain-containing protein [Nitrososphaeria archaeon]NIN52233.1 DUF4392 domain-containing protein [Nitrososphaeria archaeon]NIQ32689.1 DUF4392 domain-containing protein [Nitrososphaeria archaeon]
MLAKKDRRLVGEAVDRLITVPMSNWAILVGLPIVKLYEATREKVGEPLTIYAAEKLADAVKPGDIVIVTTGFIVPTVLEGETDGPIGAAALARSIDVGLQASPVMITEEVLTEMLRATCQAAGLHPFKHKKVAERPRRVAVEGFPVDPDEAERAACKMLEDLNPSAIISIERPGYNEKGIYHSGGGIDITSFTAKIDYLVDEAKSRGILTIGIGDLGNELGMGHILDDVKRLVPWATKCKCPCRGGIASAAATDVLIVATVSNWGAYGLEACLATVLAEPEVMHDMTTEKLLLKTSVLAGAIDSVSGLSRPAVDGVSEEINAYLIELLRNIIQMKLKENMFTKEYRKALKKM